MNFWAAVAATGKRRSGHEPHDRWDSLGCQSTAAHHHKEIRMKKPKPTAKPDPTPKPITDLNTLPAFLTVNDVAALLRRKPRSIYELVEKGLIPCARPPGTRMIIFEKKAVLDWITYNRT
jgi:excisionase family DNA binding protein